MNSVMKNLLQAKNCSALFELQIMIDYRIIRNIININESGPPSQLEENKKQEWSSDSRFIFFPVKKGNYSERVNALEAVQYLQRIRLLYTMLMRTN